MHRRAVAVLGRGGKVDGAVEELGTLGEVAALALVVNGAGTLGVLDSRRVTLGVLELGALGQVAALALVVNNGAGTLGVLEAL